MASAHSKTKRIKFKHGITIQLDGDKFYLAGPPAGKNGETDGPGHAWIQGGNELIGLHYNLGPNRKPRFWTSKETSYQLLYFVSAIIDTWTAEKALDYKDRGYVHYHELIKISDGKPHPEKVVWLKHIAVTNFNLDGGPAPQLGHEVLPGVDLLFVPNGLEAYRP